MSTKSHQLRPYFKDGVFSEKFVAITPGFVEAFSIGLIRYMGDSRTAATGEERPLSCLFSVAEDANSAQIFGYFKDAFEYLGIDFENLGAKPLDVLKTALYDKDCDAGLAIRAHDDEIKIEVFERGDEVGGLEASLPGGVNFEGKVKFASHALPIPQIAVNHIEHALNTEIGFSR